LQAIEHDGIKCEGRNATLVYPADSAARNPTVIAALAVDPVGVTSGAIASVVAHSKSLVGFEVADRKCGSAPSLPAGTGYIFVFEKDTDVVLVPNNVATLAKNARHIALFIPGAKFAGCLYNASSAADETAADASAAGAVPDSSPGAPVNKTKESSCFPSDAMVSLESGATIPMSSLAIGDSVAVGAGFFSPVFAFTHKDPSAVSAFITISTSSGASLRLTPGHHLYVNGDLVVASSVVVGDTLELESGAISAVSSITSGVNTGLYNPQTLEGSIIVDGVRASTYTASVDPAFAHAALTPLRALFRLFGAAPLSLSYGAETVAALLPSAVL
jgi:hypothetical protein